MRLLLDLLIINELGHHTRSWALFEEKGSKEKKEF
jgi:hypothetical protein